MIPDTTAYEGKMLRALFMTAGILLVSGCGDPESRIPLPTGSGAWVLIKGDHLQGAGEAIVFTRDQAGVETHLEGTYTTKPIGPGSGYLTVAAPCGELRFLRIRDGLSFYSPSGQPTTKDTKNCGVNRTGYEGWQLLFNPASQS
ncbi:hypothetical protein [Pseudomonas veronii]|uniref:hypothetical protein n=1 Tax=Pseudomonas veronii TaxID=76761 RepID=UPI0019002A92|nr:hypothetical protein [Pseudomonas veronii]